MHTSIPEPQRAGQRGIPGPRLLRRCPGGVRTARRIGLLLLAVCTAQAAVVNLVVLQTADIHACVGPAAEPDRGDWLRLAPVIRQVRDRHGADRTLLIDCGDCIEGTFLGTFTRGEVAIRLLQALEYDLWVPGNHEFDFGAARLLELCRLAVPTVCGNLELFPDGERERPPAWLWIERGGARVAVIGATASYMSQWFYGLGTEGYRVRPAVDRIEEVLPDILRRRPDLIVLAAHQGWQESDPRGVNEIRAIAERFPEIDLVLGAHTHRLFPGQRIGHDTWYLQPGALGTHLGVAYVSVDTEAHAVVDIRSELLPAAETPDPQAQAAVADLLDAAEWAAKTLAANLTNAVPSRGTPGISCATSELLCRALAAATGATAALHGRLSQDGFDAGTVTEADLFRVVPYENTAVLAEFTAAELEAVVAEQLDNRESYVYCGVWGAEFRIAEAESREEDDPQATASAREDTPPQTAVAMLNPPDGEGRLLTVLNSYTAAGGGGRFPILRRILARPETRARDTGLSSRDALRTYLGKHPDLSPPKRWIHGSLAAFDRARTPAKP
ncbi:MAG: metallophosphoesterase [Lentisphaeria bacterium]|nr:metallophosphoesterase [Lentisphaeria bacterium]